MKPKHRTNILLSKPLSLAIDPDLHLACRQYILVHRLTWDSFADRAFKALLAQGNPEPPPKKM